MTIEKEVADSVLQSDIKIILNGNSYTVERPRMGTMLRASAFISELPQGKVSDDEFLSTLLNNKYYKAIINAIATIVVGMHEKYEIEAVKKDIEFEYGENVLAALIQILSSINSEVFFSLITSLNGVNLTKPNKTTASGQS